MTTGLNQINMIKQIIDKIFLQNGLLKLFIHERGLVDEYAQLITKQNNEWGYEPKKSKTTKRIVRKYEDEIKIEGLREFIKFCNKKNFSGRLRVAWRLLWRRV